MLQKENGLYTYGVSETPVAFAVYFDHGTLIYLNSYNVNKKE